MSNLVNLNSYKQNDASQRKEYRKGETGGVVSQGYKASGTQGE
jgi:hypothetical protein